MYLKESLISNSHVGEHLAPNLIAQVAESHCQLNIKATHISYVHVRVYLRMTGLLTLERGHSDELTHFEP